MSEKIWYQLEPDIVVKKLNSTFEGLSTNEAKLRQKQYGHNQIPETPIQSHIITFFQQFANPLIYVLIVVGIISIILNHYLDMAIITIVVLVNAIIGYLQEIKSQSALEKLKSYLILKSKVLRDSEPNEIEATDLIPGDIVLVEPGAKIPADMRLIENNDLRVNESTLTGEATPVAKKTDSIVGQTPLGDQRNMLFSGTFVTSGRGKGIVVAIGAATEFGKIAASLEQAAPPPSPLELQLKTLSRQIVIIVLISVVILAIIGFLRQMNSFHIFLTAINLAVSAIPEGLPAVLTITMALGVRAMARKHAIVRHLSSVETLGAVTLVATDKTGTLTRDEMEIEKIYIEPNYIDITGEGYIPVGKFLLKKRPLHPLKNHVLKHFLITGALCNSSSLVKEGDDWKIIGDPTEGSLLVAAAKAGLPPIALEERYKKLDEIPFHTAKRFMATLHHDEKDGHIISIKGATEKVLPFCNTFYQNNHRHRLTKSIKQHFVAINHQLASEGYRVLMLAFKEEHAHHKISEQDLKGATLLGLCALKDSPRPEAIAAISLAHRAGIRVIMITGDHALTAQNVAYHMGITSETISQKPYPSVIGDELDMMSASEMNQASKYCNIFARISPLNKLELVKLFQKKHRLVAVTGDGINDAPALKQADIGIAMGKTGTDVSREASDIILADDNFATIVKAIEEGRTIYQNIRRVILFLISTNIGEIFVIGGALLAGATFIPDLPLPLQPIQLLWINLLTDGVGTIPLALEPKHGNIMNDPPRRISDPLIDNVMRWRILLVAITMAIGTITLFVWEYNHNDYDQARTVAFEAMVLFQILNVFNCRSLTESAFKFPVFKNLYITGAFTVSWGLTILAVYIPGLQKMFYTTSLDLWQWLRLIIVCSTVIAVVEFEKYLRRSFLKFSPSPSVTKSKPSPSTS